MVGLNSGQPQGTLDLATYNWKNRLLLVFAPREEDETYQNFMEKLQGQEDEITDRDLIIFSIFESGESRLRDSSIDQHSAASLRNRFSIQPGQFIVVLVGKGGGEKLRRKSEVELKEIFSLIDSMPMRQREMRERSVFQLH
ncbi:MAG: DUF4174 domain-containing protein [Proteobacteria bacterium]|nr:DUF4174 domain-containing protein [Pseudomonadota bacterium]NIS72452.1 DUF4174 domain-containing protein [Pseudomonadota bacterium]